MLENLQQYREVTPIPVVLVGNKADLKVRREVSCFKFFFHITVSFLNTIK